MTQEQLEKKKKLVKPLALTAGILGAVQGIAWLVFSVLCICLYDGSIKIENDSNSAYYKLIYDIFLNGSDLGTNTDVLIQPQEFFIFSLFYLVFSCIWLCLSCVIVWTMIRDKWIHTKILFGAWSTITILESIVDIVLTGLLIGDYMNISDNAPTEDLVAYGIVFSIAARGYVLWIVNVIFTIIMMKFTIDILLKEDKEPSMPIIHGFESNTANPPWFSNEVKDFWAQPQQDPPQTDGYANRGFERSPSFYPVQMPQSPTYAALTESTYSIAPVGIHLQQPPPPKNKVNGANPPPMPKNLPTFNTAPTPSSNNRSQSFAEAIAYKTATIGKNKGKSQLNAISPPVIPDPDYTPPGSPRTQNSLKSVLRSTSHY